MESGPFFRPALKHSSTSTSPNQLETLLDFFFFFRCFIKNFALSAKHVTRLLTSNQPLEWEMDPEETLSLLKISLTSAPILGCLCPCFATEIHAGAGNRGTGAVSLQKQDGVEHAVPYPSRILTPAERNYATSERE